MPDKTKADYLVTTFVIVCCLVVVAFAIGIVHLVWSDHSSDSTPEKSIIAGTVSSGTPCLSITDDVALDLLYDKIQPTFNDFNVQNHEATINQLNDEQRRLDCFRHWALSLKDPCARVAYLNWVDFYQGNLNDAFREYNTHAGEIQQGNYESAEEQKRKRIKKFESEHRDFPVPPNTCAR